MFLFSCDKIQSDLILEKEKSCEDVSRQICGLQRERMTAESSLKESGLLKFPSELLF